MPVGERRVIAISRVRRAACPSKASPKASMRGSSAILVILLVKDIVRTGFSQLPDSEEPILPFRLGYIYVGVIYVPDPDSFRNSPACSETQQDRLSVFVLGERICRDDRNKFIDRFISAVEPEFPFMAR